MSFTSERLLPALRRNARKPEFPAIILLTGIIILNAMLQPTFFRLNVLHSNILTFTPLILISIGQAIVVLGGGLDLSVGTQVSLINVILSVMMGNGANPWTAMGVAALASLGMGLVNGFAAGYLRLPPVISTFATAAIWFGLALLILPQPGGSIPYEVVQAFNARIFLLSIPLLLIIGSLLVWAYLRRRRLGQYIYAVGSDEEAAYANGIDVRRIKMASYVLCSLFVLLAGFAITYQTASGDARLGTAYALNSIAAVVVGGIALKGGEGNVLGAVLGAIILSMVINLIFFAKIPSEYQEFTKGFIIIVALGLAVLYKRGQKTTAAGLA